MRFLNSIFFILLLFIILTITINQFVVLIHLHVAAAETDLLRQGDQVDYLVSANRTFTLGFYGFYTVSNVQTVTYLGIWYTDDSDRKLWIANRDMPMLFSDDDGGGTLMLDNSGTLKVVRGDGNNTTTMFNIKVANSGNNTIAVLEESGNFVLYDNTTTRRILWQSFDYPTDTLLPGMKLGYNLTTKQNWTLTSWLRNYDPASGAFTMSLEHIKKSHHLVIYRHGKVYWTSGPWSGGEMGFDSLFEASGRGSLVYYDASGMYFSIPNNMYRVHGGDTSRSTVQLSTMGEIIQDGTDVLTPSSCYASYEGISDNGCAAISALPKCRDKYDKYDSFQFNTGSWVGQKIHSEDNSNISISDCRDICLKDCNCRGFSTLGILTAGCYTWGVNAQFIPDQTAVKDGGLLLSQNLPQQKKSKTWIWVVCAATLFAAFFYYVWIRRRKLKKMREDNYIHQLLGSSDSFNYGDELEKGINDAPNVKIFSLKAILDATHNFSNENKLGQGGYGPVYKGILFDGRQIAVKRLSKTSGQGIKEFKSELILISKLQHTNLVRLYGCCIHREEKMLIYEFMSNKSLDFFLFDEDKKKTLDWQMRFNIIEGVARGLLYLHKYSRMKIIHRDLKVNNILLDETMKPKIADFGMAKIFRRNVTEEITKRVVGTLGYMAPEYAMRGTFSIKSDIFSFGVLILETVSGKRNSRFYSLDRALNLLGYAWELWKRETSIELKDESLGESCDQNQILRTIHIGLLCVQENADDRPTIPEVISMFNKEIAVLPSPKQPAFFTGASLDSLDKNIPPSINGLTITTMGAR